MEKVIECGIRIKENDLGKDDKQFSVILDKCCLRVSDLISAQRDAYLATQANASAKSFEGFTPYKGLELYCEIKGVPQIFQPEDKGLVCGFRVKEFVLELPDGAFRDYLRASVDVFRESITQQRTAYQGAAEKAVALADDLKEIEFYCETKSMCS